MTIARVISLSLLVSVTLSAGISHGQTTLKAFMNNFNEPAGGVLGTLVPTTTGGQPRPGSFGTATFQLSADMTSMTMFAEVFNIDFTGSQTVDTNDNLTAAHIHASASVTPTTTGGVVWGFIGSPFNDNNPNDQVVTPFATGVGGTVSAKWDAPEGNGGTTLALQLSNILNNRSYVNFHTTQFGGGEVRGTIVVVPEPTALVLIAVGSLAVIATRRRRS
jgi:hypothetical protein